MKTSHFTLIASAALALTVAGCGKAASGDNSAGASIDNLTSKPDGGDTATETEVAVNGMVAETPVVAAAFANQAAAGDQFEIQSSELAKTKAGSAVVKSFAAMLVTEHTKSTADLRAAAAKAAPGVVPAPVLTAEQQANLLALKNAATGDAFDKLYAQVQVPSHENALALMRGYAERGDTPSLKAFAGATATVVEKHLDAARKLAK